MPRLVTAAILASALGLAACGTGTGERAISGGALGAGVGAGAAGVTGGNIGTGALLGGAAGAAAGALTDEDDIYLGEPIWRR